MLKSIFYRFENDGKGGVKCFIHLEQKTFFSIIKRSVGCVATGIALAV